MVNQELLKYMQTMPSVEELHSFAALNGIAEDDMADTIQHFLMILVARVQTGEIGLSDTIRQTLDEELVVLIGTDPNVSSVTDLLLSKVN